MDRRKKQFVIKNPFPVESFRRRKGEGQLRDTDSIMIITSKGESDTDRRLINDEIGLIDFFSFRDNVLEQAGTLKIYDDIAIRDADPASSEAGAISFVRNVSADPVVGRNIWGLYIYDGDYVLVATEEDVIFSSDLPDTATAVATAGTIVQGQTQVGGLKGLTFSKFMETMLFILNPTKINNSAGLGTVPSGTIEDGTTVGIQMNATYNAGTIQSSDTPQSPDVDLTGPPNQYTFSNNKGFNQVVASSALAESVTATSFTIGVETVTSTVVVDFDQGTDPYFDGAGQPSTFFDSDRGPGSTQANVNLNGRRFAFYRGDDTVYPTNSAEIRTGATSTLNASDNGSFNIVVPQGSLNAWFAVPTGKTATVLLVESSNADVTSSFDVTQVSVNTGGGSGPAITYDLYTEKPRASFTSTVNYDVTIS